MNKSKSNAWVSPKMVRIGNIASVAGTTAPAKTQNSGGSACTIGSPACAFS